MNKKVFGIILLGAAFVLAVVFASNKKSPAQPTEDTSQKQVEVKYYTFNGKILEVKDGQIFLEAPKAVKEGNVTVIEMGKQTVTTNSETKFVDQRKSGQETDIKITDFKKGSEVTIYTITPVKEGETVTATKIGLIK